MANAGPVMLRPELEVLPQRMRDLPIDERGYVVPWFVAWIDGKPEFRIMDAAKRTRAVRENLCWVCGQKLGVHLAFTIGPMCAVNRVSSEPPSHLDCARWSARNCPFLSRPHMIRREGGMPDGCPHQAGVPILRNPGVTLIWVTRLYKPFRVKENTESGAQPGWLIEVGEPESFEWFAEGREATREEVIASVDSGLPALLEAARSQGPQAVAAIEREIVRFEKYLPEQNLVVLA